MLDFDEILRTQQSQIRNAIFPYLRHGEDYRTSDIYQEVCLKIWRMLPRFDTCRDGSLGSWIFTVSRRTAIDKYREVHRSRQCNEIKEILFADLVEYDKGHEPLLVAEDKQLKNVDVCDSLQRVFKLLQSFRTEYSQQERWVNRDVVIEIIIERYAYGYDTVELGEKYKVKKNTITYRCKRAISLVTERLDPKIHF